jgi:hypothetical protein
MASYAALGSAVVCARRGISSRASEFGSAAYLFAVIGDTSFDVAATRNAAYAVTATTTVFATSGAGCASGCSIYEVARRMFRRKVF